MIESEQNLQFAIILTFKQNLKSDSVVHNPMMPSALLYHGFT